MDADDTTSGLELRHSGLVLPPPSPPSDSPTSSATQSQYYSAKSSISKGSSSTETPRPIKRVSRDEVLDISGPESASKSNLDRVGAVAEPAGASSSRGVRRDPKSTAIGKTYKGGKTRGETSRRSKGTKQSWKGKEMSDHDRQRTNARRNSVARARPHVEHVHNEDGDEDSENTETGNKKFRELIERFRNPNTRPGEHSPQLSPSSSTFPDSQTSTDTWESQQSTPSADYSPLIPSSLTLGSYPPLDTGQFLGGDLDSFPHLEEGDPDTTNALEVLLEGAVGNELAAVIDISHEVKLVESDAVGAGGFCDLFVGHHDRLGKVAMKRPRFTHTEANVLKRFKKEAQLWSTFNHQGILPFLGMAQIGRHVYLVSPWIEYGNLSERLIVEKRLDRLSLLREMADALRYLHDLNVVHGDVKSQNVLITNDGGALLCDFGLTKLLDKMITSTEVKGAGSTRYMAPELLLDGPKSLASDVYAFAMTMVEIISGRPPFSHIESNSAVIVDVVVTDGRPLREPAHSKMGEFYEPLWGLVERCWATQPESRLGMKEVFERLSLL